MKKNKKNYVTTINDIKMIIEGDYCWEVLKDIDGTELYRIVLGEVGQERELITCLYVNDIFSIRLFDTTYSGEGDTFYFNISFKKTSSVVKALLEAHKLKLSPIYSIKTIKLS